MAETQEAHTILRYKENNHGCFIDGGGQNKGPSSAEDLLLKPHQLSFLNLPFSFPLLFSFLPIFFIFLSLLKSALKDFLNKL